MFKYRAYFLKKKLREQIELIPSLEYASNIKNVIASHRWVQVPLEQIKYSEVKISHCEYIIEEKGREKLVKVS